MNRPLTLTFVGLLLTTLCLAQSLEDSVIFKPLGKSGLFKTATFRNKRYFVCELEPKKYKIELFNRIDSKNSQHHFSSIDSLKGSSLVLVVNGGMFMEDLRPLGLYVSNEKTYMRIKRDTAGYGNFYMQPNGIFIIDKSSKPQLITTREYTDKTPVMLATQSGPMLVTKNRINGNFKKGSANVNIRNGVGINKKGNIVFVTSDDFVNFHEFAELYRDHLDCDNALYLDGAVSQYYAPELRQTAQTYRLGVFIVVTRK